MPNITKHYSELKREGYDCENSWVHLLIPWNPISINDLLENPCKLI